jgi:hypothetical protein
MFEPDHVADHLLDQPPKRFDHHPVLRGLLASSVAFVSATGSGKGVATGEGEDAGARLSPLETGAGSRTVERRRGASGSGIEVSGITEAGAAEGDGASKSAVVSMATGASVCCGENSPVGEKSGCDGWSSPT